MSNYIVCAIAESIQELLLRIQVLQQERDTALSQRQQAFDAMQTWHSEKQQFVDYVKQSERAKVWPV